jgi:DNA-directed RNA polymerase specialized sigma24 family protein
MTKAKEAFEEFLRRLDPDSTSEETTYQKLRLKLVRYFSWKRCFDPEEQTDETIQRLTKNLLDGTTARIESPAGYVYAIARNVYKEYVRTTIRREELAKVLQELSPLVVDEQQDCRQWCLQSLPTEKMELIIQYYASKEDRAELVHQNGINLSSLRVQVHRIKNELKACHKECLRQKHAVK